MQRSKSNRSIASGLIGAAAAVIITTSAALAGSPQPETFAQYAHIAGETGAAHTMCDMNINFQVLTGLGKPFQMKPSELANADAMTNVLAAEMNQSLTRRQSEGDAFCVEALGKYGPNGTVAPGILTKRAE